MGFTIEVEFLRGLFEAGDGPQRAQAEWPPSPARVFSALVAAAADDTEYDDALRWLESLEPPMIEACDEVVSAKSRESYVPLNLTEKKPSSYGRFAGRKAGSLQEWFHVAMRDPVVRYRWSVSAPSELASQLLILAEAVPYLGRSTSPVRMSATSAELDLREGSTRLVAGGLGRGAVVSLPFSGYLDALRSAFKDNVSAHEVPRRQLRYGRDDAMDAVEPHRSAFEVPFLVLPFARSKRVGAAYAMLVSTAVRKALEACLDGGPLVLRGAKNGEERPAQQVLILLLPQVGYAHATGLCAGIGIVLPEGVSSDDRRSIYQGLTQIEANGVAAGPLGRLHFEGTTSGLSSLDPATWARPCRRWVSATPMTLDRSVRTSDGERVMGEVRRACGFAGLPEPTEIEFAMSPLAEGAPDVPARLRVRRDGDRVLPSVHVRLTFDQDVEGPVVLGNLRRYGLGLCLPEVRR